MNAFCRYQFCDLSQLIDVLALPPGELPDAERAHALRVVQGLLTTQEHKTDATATGLAPALTRLVRETGDDEVCSINVGFASHIRCE
jgi:hypothetical protein